MIVRTVALVSVLALAAPEMLEAREQWGSSGTQQAYNEGYQRGVRTGEDDGRRSESFNYADESDYRRANAGYRREYGNQESYRTDFRRGFEQGYRTGYERYVYRNGRPGPWANGRGNGPWANGRGNGPWANGRGNGPVGNGNYGIYRNDLAFQTGFNDGYERGLDDGRDRRRNDPFAESRYRDGDHGYERRYGTRDAYKIMYRDAFRQGYERGYLDGRPTGNRSWWPF